MHMFDGRGGRLHLRNLQVYDVATEEEALRLLFRGTLNRVTSETPMNQASSRSHCIMTLTIESRHEDSAVVRRSKLHMVGCRVLCLRGTHAQASCSRCVVVCAGNRWTLLARSGRTKPRLRHNSRGLRGVTSTCRCTTSST